MLEFVTDVLWFTVLGTLWIAMVTTGIMDLAGSLGGHNPWYIYVGTTLLAGAFMYGMITGIVKKESDRQ